MDENFSQFVTLHIGVFHFFSSNVFSLLKFEDVLLAVDNAEGTRFGTQCTHVTCFEPSVLSDSLLGLLLVMINSLKEEANAARDERVVYSNLFNKIEKEIKHYEEIYKQTLIKN